MRIVLDTTVLVRANENSLGPARDLLLVIISKKHDLLLSNEILYELARVLRYPRLQRLYRLSEADVYGFVSFLREFAEIVTLDPLVIAPIRDVNDLIVVQTALIGNAEILCTTDEDFYDPIITEFLSKAGVAVMDEIGLAKHLRFS